jgi:predicted alpha/beta superfamily hydrolase
MKLSHLPIIFALLLASFFSHSGEPIVIGETLTIDSKVLMKQASINIRLPASYHGSKNKRYPVYYDIGTDGGFAVTAGTLETLSHNQGYPMPEVILVALTTETAVRIIERGVKSEDFINFLETDVIPYVDKHYRSQPFRIVASGERFGLAPLYALIHKTKLFQAYITISPWVTDKSGLVGEFETFLKSHKDLAAFLWVSSGGESRMAPDYNKVLKLLKQHAPQKLDWKTANFSQNTTASQSLLSLPNALEALFSDMYLASDSPVMSAGAQSIRDYYQQLSDNKYGYPISSERAINMLGLIMLSDDKIKKAIEVFKINLKDYSDSPHVYAGLARALIADDNLVDALPIQKTAYELATKQNDAYEDYYKQLYTETKNQLSSN